jgi:hypothetical protein
MEPNKFGRSGAENVLRTSLILLANSAGWEKINVMLVIIGASNAPRPRIAVSGTCHPPLRAQMYLTDYLRPAAAISMSGRPGQVLAPRWHIQPG